MNKAEFDDLFRLIEDSESRLETQKRVLAQEQARCRHDWGEVKPIIRPGHWTEDYMSYGAAHGRCPPERMWVPEKLAGHERVCRICRKREMATGYDEQVIKTPRFS